mmetsp:Transcript_16557/g.50128  ORF Transcript_16557/g.50128 Transcript_16557/m.50128 type:complete len:102 (-) Transcript_16557:1408-1713(-)
MSGFRKNGRQCASTETPAFAAAASRRFFPTLHHGHTVSDTIFTTTLFFAIFLSRDRLLDGLLLAPLGFSPRRTSGAQTKLGERDTNNATANRNEKPSSLTT